MIVALAAITAAGIVLPHVLRLQRVDTVIAVVLWLSSLALRALAGVLAVIYLLWFLPRTELFGALTHWCVHIALPAGAELDVEGHGLADIVLYGPGVLLAASMLAVGARTARDARAARHLVAQHYVADGPRNSLIVGGREVLFAVAGLSRPRIVVSAGALTSLDDDELAAGLDHEQGHIARRHRFVMLLAVGLRGLGRAIPGGGRGVRELAFHLERDADRWALRQSNDRLALASVICKATVDNPSRPATLVNLHGSGVRERVSQLLDKPPPARPRRTGAALSALATVLVACTLVLGAVVPAAAVTGAAGDAHRGHHQHCEH